MVVFSTARNLRATMALCSILAIVFGVVTMYSNISGGVLVGRFLRRGRHVWLGVLVMSGEDRPETHTIDLDYDDRSDEMAVWFSAGFCILAGALGLLKICVDAYQRRRINLGGFVGAPITPSKIHVRLTHQQYETSTSPFWTILAHIPAFTALIAFVMTFASAVYTWQQRLTMQQNTCYWQLGEKGDAVFKCTRELAVCEISPYLLKNDVSERARSLRQKACEQLVHFPSYSVFGP